MVGEGRKNDKVGEGRRTLEKVDGGGDGDDGDDDGSEDSSFLFTQLSDGNARNAATCKRNYEAPKWPRATSPPHGLQGRNVKWLGDDPVARPRIKRHKWPNGDDTVTCKTCRVNRVPVIHQQRQ